VGTALNGIVSFAPVFTNAAPSRQHQRAAKPPLTAGAQVDGFPSPHGAVVFEGAGDPNFIAICGRDEPDPDPAPHGTHERGSYFCEASNSSEWPPAGGDRDL
jgi:hypothetical protein